MIVWGGGRLNSGGRYDPAHDAWAPTATNGAFSALPPGGPPQGPAVWTGSEMIVWSDTRWAGRYDPATDRWTAVSAVGAPGPRSAHTLVWTGSEMIVWGGSLDSSSQHPGGRYDPAADRWSATTMAGAPLERTNHTAVWTGREMIVWGGYACCAYFNTGYRYDPVADRWSPTRADSTAPVGRWLHTAVWTGREMIIWGGENGNLPAPPYQLKSGGRYDPVADSWTPTKDNASAPDPREAHSAVWTGTEMIVWGGLGTTTFLNTGWIYDGAALTLKDQTAFGSLAADSGRGGARGPLPARFGVDGPRADRLGRNPRRHVPGHADLRWPLRSRDGCLDADPGRRHDPRPARRCDRRLDRQRDDRLGRPRPLCRGLEHRRGLLHIHVQAGRFLPRRGW